MASAIAAVCIGQGDVCVKTLDAGTRQVGIRQQFDLAEATTTRYINNKLEDELTERQRSVAGATGFLIKTARDRKLMLRAPNLGVADSIINEITPNSYMLWLKWNF
jgi:hypothetical protein